MKVVTSVNKAYLGLLDGWLRQSAAAVGMPVTVACMDDAARAHCEGRDGIEVVVPPANPHGARHDFWLRRLAILSRMLDGGDVVHTDVDAFWLESPWPLMERLPDDLVFSREFGIPRHVAARWGFVLCCGFFLARSTVASRAFFARWIALTRRHMDDQRALNELLLGLGASWTPVDEPGLRGERCTVNVDGHDVSIFALSYAQFSREPPFAVTGATVAHPYFERPFFRSYVELVTGLLDETGRVSFVPGMDEVLVPSGVRRRDATTACALRWLLARRPGNAANWAHLAALSLRLGDTEGAATALDHARAAGDFDSWTLFLLGAGEAGLDRRVEAVSTLRQLARRDDLELDLMRRSAVTLARLGAWRDAAGLALRAGRAAGFAGGMAMVTRHLQARLSG
ncbi:MAG: putative nucleotide-diphospho-sugar transferase [Sphingomonadales bacterium]